MKEATPGGEAPAVDAHIRTVQSTAMLFILFSLPLSGLFGPRLAQWKRVHRPFKSDEQHASITGRARSPRRFQSFLRGLP